MTTKSYIYNLIDDSLNAFLGSNGLFDELNFVKNFENRFIDSNYPPCNIVRNFSDPEKKNIKSYDILFALAGYRKNDRTIKEFTENSTRYLHIDNSKYFEKEQKEVYCDYLKKGISYKKFSIDFLLSDDLEVNGVVMVDGLLIIRLNVKKNETHSVKNIEIK